MNITNAAEALCRYLEDPTFAAAVRSNPSEATKGLGLSNEEIQTLFGGDDASALPMKGFREISKRLGEVPVALQQRLNNALGMHASAGRSIPCTGQARLQ